MQCTTLCRLMIFIGTVVLHLWPATALAQEQQALDLTLRKTHIKTTAELLSLAPPLADAFTPTTVTCPANATCLLRVEVNAGIAQFPTQATLRACLRVDDSFTGVFPQACQATS